MPAAEKYIEGVSEAALEEVTGVVERSDSEISHIIEDMKTTMHIFFTCR
ncbi:MAG: hypothetical protein JXK07_00765 [Spirochaetes bacterium]|nr:hypothetical protein [Spirochaetota bacterium]MBN2771675.1 hypothetical protein [Spirochaetota bacterium]